jgi:hypothetical protein
MTIDSSGNPNPQPEKPNPFNLLAVVVVTAVFVGLSFWLSGKEEINEHQREFLFLSNETWRAGLIAMIGLLASKR